MPSLQNLEKRVESIEKRNLLVESNKAWETSAFRKVIIAILTYGVIGSYMSFIGVSSPWINAIIPTLGFLLSTLTLNIFKQLWLKFIYKR